MALPIVPIVLAGGALALLALLTGKKDAKASPGTPKKPVKSPVANASPTVKKAVIEAERTKNPKILKVAIGKAIVEGNRPLAAAIKKRYDGMRVETASVVYKTPTAAIRPVDWTKFVNSNKGANPRAVTKDFHVGLFGFGARRLVDLKVMKSPKQIVYQGRKVWSGDWAAPWDLKKFLADTAFQYRLFVQSSKDYMARVATNAALKSAVGSTIDGKKVTLSGILAVCHKAGFTGAVKWATNPKDRAKFVATTAAFNRSNGIF